ncbi:MAG: MarR family transcriptional regulator [ANME-2 cluster archaeon]|nr:MarR family transcriptional regulator [ANME-2 cluster archaeon]MCL7475324.1 MarR family transcriptional regulator [ANME-2 cluster archaeon]MDF1530897.1 MarR family transcriptional regulator [ANME-2 cluster archaeon]MDW7776204.1 MarR family transcriptional regulator [Methanosarcinales archaeon]
MGSLEKLFGKTAQLQVLENILNNRGNTTFLFGIAEETGLSHSSVSRVMEPLIKLGIVKEQKVGKVFRTFALDEENEFTKKLLKFHKDIERLSEKYQN